MATMRFCAYDGTMFRGKTQPMTKFPSCQYEEKPVTNIQGFVPCQDCPYYAEATRRHNHEPYKYTTQDRYGRDIIHNIPVTGGDNKQMKQNRRHCGELIRRVKHHDKI